MILSSKKLIFIICLLVGIVFFLPNFLSSYAQHVPGGENPPPGGIPPPPPSGEGGQDPGGTGNENCVCQKPTYENGTGTNGCNPGQAKITYNCNSSCSANGTSQCIDVSKLGYAPVWVEIMSQETNGIYSWKGNQYEDIVLAGPWSVDPASPTTPGGIDDE